MNTFFERPDITRSSTRSKDNVYIGKVAGERTYLPVRYLLWTIKETQNIANHADKVETAETFINKFNKELTFRQIYSYLKKHKEIKWNAKIPHESCTCEICDNIKLFIRDINKNIVSKIPEDCEKIDDRYTCENSNA